MPLFVYFGVILVLSALCRWACHLIAKSKYRNKELWMVLGVMFGILAIIILLLQPNLLG